MKVILFLGQNIDISKYDLSDSFIIGVDKGCYILTKNNICYDLAVGDFDSVCDAEYNMLEKYAKNIIKLNPIKDKTDTFVALTEALKISKDIKILGGISGKRIEHLFANICLLEKYPNIEMLDDDTLIKVLDNDTFINYPDYKFVSFYALKDSFISLSGFKYNLDKYELKLYDPLCISNEVKENALIKIHNGKVLMILSKNDTL